MSPRECLERARPTGCAPCSRRWRGLPGGRRSSHGLFRGSWGARCGVCPRCWMPSWELDWQELLCAPTSGLGAGLLPHTLGSSSSVSRRPRGAPTGTHSTLRSPCLHLGSEEGKDSLRYQRADRTRERRVGASCPRAPAGGGGGLWTPYSGPSQPRPGGSWEGALSGVLCTLKKERSSSV